MVEPQMKSFREPVVISAVRHPRPGRGGLVKWLSPLGWVVSLVIGAVVVAYLLFGEEAWRDLTRQIHSRQQQVGDPAQPCDGGGRRSRTECRRGRTSGNRMRKLTAARVSEIGARSSGDSVATSPRRIARTPASRYKSQALASPANPKPRPGRRRRSWAMYSPASPPNPTPRRGRSALRCDAGGGRRSAR